jgi:AAA domain-containing protein
MTASQLDHAPGHMNGAEAQCRLTAYVRAIASASTDQQLSVISMAAGAMVESTERGDIEKVDVIDRLQGAADWCGAVTNHGQDAVQEALASPFRRDGNGIESCYSETTAPPLYGQDGPNADLYREKPINLDHRLAGTVIKTAATLRTMTFAPLKYIVPGLIVEGLVLLAGRPKVGKSWLALDIGIAVASGRPCLGDRKPEHGDVLGLFLEDGDQRLQRRIDKILPTLDPEWPERLEYATRWPRADQGGAEAIDAWCEQHPSARLVVIDVLAKFRAPLTNKNAYEQDYAALSKLQEVATRRSITILVLHHTRKGASDDPVEEISGTLGLAGAADAFLVLKCTGSGSTLIGRGRDTEEVDLAVQFSRETCRWTILGAAAEVHQSDERSRVLAALDGADQGLHVTEIIAGAQLTSRTAADKLLFRMLAEGKIEKIKRGVYGLPGTVSRIQREMREKGRSSRKTFKYQEDEPQSPNHPHLPWATNNREKLPIAAIRSTVMAGGDQQ